MKYTLLLLVFALLMCLRIVHAQPITRDSVVVDTTIIHKDPYTKVVKVYLPFKTKQSNKFFLQAGYELNSTKLEEQEFTIDSTTLKVDQTYPKGNFVFEGGYYSNIFRFKIGFSKKDFEVNKTSVTNTSRVSTSHFIVWDTIDSYYVIVDNVKELRYVTRPRKDSTVTKNNYVTERAGKEKIQTIEFPVSIAVPFNIKKILLHPEIGLSLLFTRSHTYNGFIYSDFSQISSKSRFNYFPSASFSIGYPLISNLYLNSRVSYKLNVNPHHRAPTMHKGVLSYGLLLTYLF